MKAAILSEESRPAGNYILFDVDDAGYNPEGTRVISKQTALDGTVLTTDWGYPEGKRVIRISNVMMSREDYEILIGMKEDTSHTFLYLYKENVWKVAVQSARGVQTGESVSVNLSLSVISRYSDCETS